MNGSDQDSDSLYTTNQKEIVEHAKYCYANYPTIVNEINPEKNIYNLSLENYAKIDNSLTSAQMAIGQSSNLAQLALTYTYNFEDKKYQDYVCILSVLAQCAIDNAKRKFDVDLDAEISRIDKDLNKVENGLPKFWLITKKDKMKSRTEEQRRERQRKTKDKIKKNINPNLVCPMNYIYDLDFNKFRSKVSTIPMSEFFIKHKMTDQHRTCKQVEKLIQDYSLELYKYNVEEDDDDNTYLLLRNDFNELVENIRRIYISKNYLGLMSWLINRAFGISGYNNNTKINKNRSLLIKVLYTVNKDAFLSCFKQKTENEEL